MPPYQQEATLSSKAVDTKITSKSLFSVGITFSACDE